MQKKIPDEKLTQHHNWIYEKGEKENVETLRKWVIQEVEFKTVVAERIHGLKDPNNKYHRKEKSFFTNSKPGKISVCQGEICGKEHVIWTCNKFKSLNIHERWKAEKQHHLCYRYLGVGNLGQECSRIQTYSIDGCKEMHNRMLHGKETSVKNSTERNENINSRADEKSCTQLEIWSSSTDMEKEQSRNDKEESHSGKSKEKEQKDERFHTTDTNQTTSAMSDFISLRTFPVTYINKKTYINNGIAEQLKLKGIPKQVRVNALNNQGKIFQTLPVELNLESVYGKIKERVSAYMVDRVTGSMKLINWKKYKDKWRHLESINFPVLGRRSVVDILIGMDYAELHFSKKRHNRGDWRTNNTPYTAWMDLYRKQQYQL